MQRRISNRRGSVAILAAVAVFHLGLLWLLLEASSTYQMASSVSMLVRLIVPETVKPKLGAPLKTPITTRSEFEIPQIALPKIVVMIALSPNEVPAPAARSSGSSAPSLGDHVPTAAPAPDDFSAYLKLVQKKAQGTLDEITSRRWSQRAGSLIIALYIDRSGKILAWAIADAQHSPSLNAEAKELIAQCDPLPPFPAGIRADHFVTTVKVTFHGFRNDNGGF